MEQNLSSGQVWLVEMPTPSQVSLSRKAYVDSSVAEYEGTIGSNVPEYESSYGVMYGWLERDLLSQT